MPVSGLRTFRLTPAAERYTVRPECRDWLDAAGLRTATDFLTLPGVVVSGHVGRNVSRVEIAGTTAYLKREHRVRVRDRFRAWRDGFGWQSVSAREAAVLRRLDGHQLPGPKWLAYGEAGGVAFLLVAAAEGENDLRSVPRLPASHAARLGLVIARLHAAGVDQPDLFAKHVLIRPDTGRFTILDWQRAVLRETVPWAARVRSLAALRATAGGAAFSAHMWTELLSAYLAEAGTAGGRVPSLGHLAGQVDGLARSLARRPGFRLHRPTAVPQELVRIDGETVCAVPAVATELAGPEAIARLYDPANDGMRLSLRQGRMGVLGVRRTRLPFGRWWATVRGRVWRSPELRVARLLFHLERFQIPAPKLLAYGQRPSVAGPAGSFVLSEPGRSRPIRCEDGDRVRELLDRLHVAGCRLTGLGRDGQPFGMDGETPVIRDAGYIRLCRWVTRRQARRDFARLDAFFAGCR